MKFGVPSADLLNAISSMKSIVEAKKDYSTNIRFSKDIDGDKLVIEYVGQEAYGKSRIRAKFKESKTSDDPILTNANFILKLSKDFKGYTFSTGLDSIVEVTADKGALKLQLPVFEDKTYDNLILPISNTNIHFDEKDCKILQSIVKHASAFTYSGDNEIANKQFTSVNLIIRKEETGYSLVIIMSDTANLLFKSFKLSEDFKGKKLKLYVPVEFFVKWNIKKNLNLGISDDKSFITLKDEDSDTVCVHNTINGDGFIDLFKFVEQEMNFDEEKIELDALIDSANFLKNLEYLSKVGVAEDIIMINMKKRPRLMVHGEGNANHIRELSVGKDTESSIVEIIKPGEINANYESLFKCLKTASDLVQGGLVRFVIHDNIAYFYSKDKSTILTSKGLKN